MTQVRMALPYHLPGDITQPDSGNTATSSTPISCGVHQLYGLAMYDYDNNTYIRSPEKVLMATVDWTNNSIGRRCAFYVFSDHNKYNNSRDQNNPDPQHGKHLAEYITEQKLGVVTASEEGINPNTGHTIQVWVWKIDHDALNNWIKVKQAEQKAKDDAKKTAEKPATVTASEPPPAPAIDPVNLPHIQVRS